MNHPAHRKVLECASSLALLSRQPKQQRTAVVQDAVALALRVLLRAFFIPSILLLWFVTGCATTPPPENHSSRPANLFPENAFLTQRAVMTTMRDREFVLNGYLALSKIGGQRLVVTDNFGDVVADVLVKPDGAVFVMRSSRMFSEKWIRNYVAADLTTIFGRAPLADWPVEQTGKNCFLLKRRGYSLFVRIVETKPGPQPPELFDATKREMP